MKETIDGKKVGWTLFPSLFEGGSEGSGENDAQMLEEDSGESVPFIDLLSPSAESEGNGPEITKNQVRPTPLQYPMLVFCTLFETSLVNGRIENTPRHWLRGHRKRLGSYTFVGK